MKGEKGCTENFIKCFFVVRSLPFHHFSALGRLLVFNCILYEGMFQVPRALLSDGHCYLICNWYDSRVAFGATIARDCTVQHSSCARSFPYTIISYFLFTALAVLSFQNGELSCPLVPEDLGEFNGHQIVDGTYVLVVCFFFFIAAPPTLLSWSP